MPVGTVAACKALLSRRAAHSITSSDGSSGEGIIGDVRSTNAHSVRAMQGLRSLRKTLSDDDEDAKVSSSLVRVETGHLRPVDRSSSCSRVLPATAQYVPHSLPCPHQLSSIVNQGGPSGFSVWWL
jgi:hypothetical protein